jgi:hypothetical protein
MILLSFYASNRLEILRCLFYIPILYLFLITRKRPKFDFSALKVLFTLIIACIFAFFIYNSSSSDYGNNKSYFEFTKSGFENSRVKYVYPGYFADMQGDFLFGRGLNGTYFSNIFVEVMNDVNLTRNSLEVKPGHRREVECGYLQTILKIGVFGLILKLILAVPAIFLGLFRSNNFFVKGCACIILEWLISMYPSALPEYRFTYILFWLCIGVCLSRETRLLKDSALFFRKPIKKQNILA